MACRGTFAYYGGLPRRFRGRDHERRPGPLCPRAPHGRRVWRTTPRVRYCHWYSYCTCMSRFPMRPARRQVLAPPSICIISSTADMTVWKDRGAKRGWSGRSTSAESCVSPNFVVPEYIHRRAASSESLFLFLCIPGVYISARRFHNTVSGRPTFALHLKRWMCKPRSFLRVTATW